MYNDVANNLSIFTIQIPNTIVPTPLNSDYAIGFIRRYFCQRANDSTGNVFEIDNDTHTLLKTNPFWKVTDIKWRITGPLDAVLKPNGEVDDIGVRASNKAAISLAVVDLKNISLYLPNVLQFYK
jgi:hypothetical protein